MGPPGPFVISSISTNQRIGANHRFASASLNPARAAQSYIWSSPILLTAK